MQRLGVLSAGYSAVPGTQSLPSTPSPPRTRPLPPHSKLSSLVPESRPQYPSPISLCTRLPFPLSAEWWLLLEGKEKKEDGVTVEDDTPLVLDVVVEGPWEGETWKTLRSQERVRWRREVLGAAAAAAAGVVELDEGVGDGIVWRKQKMKFSVATRLLSMGTSRVGGSRRSQLVL
ncbi:hypothetical protein IWX90DRAFT_167090 [Phyllosticta citrichinensis]|uniref:Uncharacterized protein n=1 Tax=Phyllosticta citrichinensis TaxID=1130410 RepID=A0ABR1Y1F5_9PEZI